MNHLCERVASIRRQICPRTAYATSGSMATQLNVLVMDGATESDVGELQGAFKEGLVQTKEFETLLPVLLKKEVAGKREIEKSY